MLNEINRGEVRTPPAPLDLFDLGKRNGKPESVTSKVR
jgi:hypothetical protein